jgi:DNA (cytosine-5)-methyltransferase 1
MMTMRPTVVEICAGTGGQALGLEQAGFVPVVLIDIDKYSCATLLGNRPKWPVLLEDVKTFDGRSYKGVDLLAGGLPCPPFSIAGHRQGEKDARNLFPAMIRLADQVRPKVIMIENVSGLMAIRFKKYRERILRQLEKLGYKGDWRLFNACDFTVPQHRPRVVLVALQKQFSERFEWPKPNGQRPLTVGETLRDLMGSRGWHGTDEWCQRASAIAPTIVGGSLKHGGPDLGPTRAKQAWAILGVDGHGIVDEAPPPDFTGNPRLTVRMVARLQSLPDDWEIFGGKTAAYRQIGNAFPPPVARAVAECIKQCLTKKAAPS